MGMQDSNLRLMGLYDFIFLDVMTRDFYFETTRSATELIPIILPRLDSNQHVRILNGREPLWFLRLPDFLYSRIKETIFATWHF